MTITQGRAFVGLPPDPPTSVIQMLGLGDGPIVLASNQLHGNRTLLLTNPETIRLDIRPIKRPLAPTTGGSASLVWRQHTGKQFPEPDVPSPTLFQDCVYGTLQQALLAFLLWTCGGATGLTKWTANPSGSTGFPHFVLKNAVHVGITTRSSTNQTEPDIDTEENIALHLLHSEPGSGSDTLLLCVGICLRPTTLVALAQQLVDLDPVVQACMVLVGSLRVQTAAVRSSATASVLTEAPQLQTELGVDWLRELNDHSDTEAFF